MKIWIGPEMEGKNKGELTMFVSAETISQQDEVVIMDLLKEHPDCKRLYLGAGRVSLLYIDSKDLQEFCKSSNIKIILEISYQFLARTIRYLNIESDQLIVRFHKNDMNTLKNCDMIKLDDGKEVRTVEIEDMVVTNLSTLKQDTFDVDVVLYEDHKKEDF